MTQPFQTGRCSLLCCGGTKMGRGPSPPPPPPPHLACLLLLLLEPQRAPPRSFWRHSDEQGDLLEQLGKAESPIIGKRIRETNSKRNKLLC